MPFKARYNRMSKLTLYFYRENHGLEFVLVFEKGQKEIELIVIKSAYAVSKDFSRNMDRFENLHQ